MRWWSALSRRAHRDSYAAWNDAVSVTLGILAGISPAPIPSFAVTAPPLNGGSGSAPAAWWTTVIGTITGAIISGVTAWVVAGRAAKASLAAQDRSAEHARELAEVARTRLDAAIRRQVKGLFDAVAWYVDLGASGAQLTSDVWEPALSDLRKRLMDVDVAAALSDEEAARVYDTLATVDRAFRYVVALEKEWSKGDAVDLRQTTWDQKRRVQWIAIYDEAAKTLRAFAAFWGSEQRESDGTEPRRV